MARSVHGRRNHHIGGNVTQLVVAQQVSHRKFSSGTVKISGGVVYASNGDSAAAWR